MGRMPACRLGILITMVSWIAASGVFAAASADGFAPVKEQLVRDGYSAHRVADAFRGTVTPMYRLVASTLHIREGKLNYDQFLEPASMSLARDFVRRHEALLASVERKYGVDRNVVAAILLVETRYGSYTGRTPALSVFATFSIMDRKANRDKVWALLSLDDRAHWGREGFDQKLLSRSHWAYEELQALLTLSERQGVRPSSFKGSVMGALGWPQFLPSSILKYGVDGNGDGVVDLNDCEDVVASVANYFKAHGWCEARTDADREAVVHTYNKSGPYVRAVLGVAERLGH